MQGVNAYRAQRDAIEVTARAEDVFRHVFRAYPRLPSPYYEDAAA